MSNPTNTPIRLLLVDDNDIDTEITRRNLRKLALDIQFLRVRNGKKDFISCVIP